MKEPKFVAFSTQKGGAGKTTLTVTVASYLYYCKGLKVLVVDCDYPQYSIDEMRKREKMLLDLSPSFKKTFSDTLVRTKLKPFPVLVCPPEEAMSKVKELVESGDDIDIVFFDLLGTVNNRGVVTVANCMDMIVVPISADKVVLESSLAYALKLQEWLTTGKSQLKGVHMLWNMVMPVRKRSYMNAMKNSSMSWACLACQPKCLIQRNIAAKVRKRLKGLFSGPRSCLRTRRCSKGRGYRNLQRNSSRLSTCDV